MFRLFSMDKCGRLFQLSSRGWVRGDGASFRSIQEVRRMLIPQGTPPLPNGQFMQDTYIARVDVKGLIVSTFPLNPVDTVIEG